MNQFSVIALHLLPQCSLSNSKVLKESGWFLFNRKYKIVNDNIEINEEYRLPANLFSDKINIQAIVGKNGSGKSSVIDLMLQIINNLAIKLTSKAHTDSELRLANGVYAELYYEIGGDIYCIKCEGEDIIYSKKTEIISVGEFIDVEPDYKGSVGPMVSLKEALPLLRNFFFTIINNYSIHSHNTADPSDLAFDSRDEWLNGIFHKNDGYLTPLVINPYRHHGNINLIKESKLVNSRLASLFYRFHKEQIDFLDDYKYQDIEFNFNKLHTQEKYKYHPVVKGTVSKKTRIKQVRIDASKRDVFNITLRCYLTSYQGGSSIEMDDAYKYLVAKTYSISEKYPNYRRYIKKAVTDFSKYCTVNEEKKVRNLVTKIKNDSSHVTLKIRQTLRFLDYANQNTYNLQKLGSNYLDYKDQHPLNKSNNNVAELDNFVISTPPPIYTIKIKLKNKEGKIIDYNRMSSGEKQFLFYMSTVLYHLKNLNSVENDEESVHYNYINIILEEVELYFHPEYQRTFIDKVIRYIESCRFNMINSINIIVVTHSPFILSDIPKDNILFLERGNQINDIEALDTFGANIHDLLRHSFFLDDGLMGEFAKKQINSLLDFLTKDENPSQWTKEEVHAVILSIGEPLIKDRLISIYDDKYPSEEMNMLKKQIKLLENELSRYKNEKDIN